MDYKAIKVAKREWKNIKTSLEMCGDIGNLDSDGFVVNRSRVTNEIWFFFMEKLLEMDEKLPSNGYATPEALTVFTILVTEAAQRLRLKENLAFAFGRGYGYVRTGWFGFHGTETEQIFFFNIFFPVEKDLSWESNSLLTKRRLKTVFEKFMKWQNDIQLYIADMRLVWEVYTGPQNIKKELHI